MSRNDSGEETGRQYFEENKDGSWQPGILRGNVQVVISIRPDVHMQIIAAGLAVTWGVPVCGIDDLSNQEWLVTPDKGKELLQKPLAEILQEKTTGSEPRAI